MRGDRAPERPFSSRPGGSQPAPGTPREASVADLRGLAEEADFPIYWAGTAPGTRFELTETSDGRVYVRYLADGAKAGDERPDFLTVGTYPVARAYPVAQEASRREGMAHAQAPAGGLAVWNEERPRSVYVAYPGSDYLVEVFSPDAAEARQLVLDGDVGPVDPDAPNRAPRTLAPLPELSP